MTASSLYHTILYYIRLCWNYIISIFHDSSSHANYGGSGGGGISLSSLFHRNQRQLLTFDNGMQVEMGQQIAEGGFSYVFEAFPVNNRKASLSAQRSSSTLTSSPDTTTTTTNDPNSSNKYALKRINCSDHEIIQSCRHEAGVHRTLPVAHPNLLELLGLKFDQDMSSSSSSLGSSSSHNEYNVCYMLFPYIPYSLRGEITKRNILHDSSAVSSLSHSGNTRRRPFTTREIVHLFGGLIDALTAMHNANISHRDVKLENILLQSQKYGDDDPSRRGNTNRNSNSNMYTPVLMDFGSAGPLTAQLTTRQQVLTTVENAASHTTMPYRPPELFEGGLRHGPREILDYGKVDVWSLGCVLFGLMHGTSPFEMEFLRSNDNQQNQQYGQVRIVECTHLKILGEVPSPSWAGIDCLENGNDRNDGKNGKYPTSLYRFIRYMVHHDRTSRPNIHQVSKRFGELHMELVGERWISYEEGRYSEAGKGQNYDDFDSLIAGRDFV